MRVLLVDANPSFAELVESAFDREPGIMLVGRAVNREQAMELALLHTPDIAFIATDLPGGIEAAQNMLCIMPKPPKIFLLRPENSDCAGHAAPAEVRGHDSGLAAGSGISGYVAKTPGAGEMISLIVAVAALAMTPRDADNGDSH